MKPVEACGTKNDPLRKALLAQASASASKPSANVASFGSEDPNTQSAQGQETVRMRGCSFEIFHAPRFPCSHESGFHCLYLHAAEGLPCCV